MLNPLQRFLGESELRELGLNDTVDRLGPKAFELLEEQIDDLQGRCRALEDRLDGLHTALVSASRSGSQRSAAPT